MYELKLRRKHRNKSSCLWIKQSFLRHNTKSTYYKIKNKLNCIKIKNFYAIKGIVKKVKRQPIEGEKYLQIIYLMRSLYLSYIKNSYKAITTKKTNNPIFKWAKILDRHFSK